MDPLDEMVARICGTMNRMSDMLTREADEMHAITVGIGRAVEAQMEAVQLLQDAMQDEAA